MDTPPNPTPDDDLKQVLAEVPAPIRALIASGKVQVIAKNLMQKNQLHIDQGAIIGRELILLLLGINTPSEFARTLVTDANLNQKIIDSVMQDVNTQIFIPLREEERKGPEEKSEQPAKQSVKPITSYVHPQNGNQISANPTQANPQLPPRPPQMYAPMPKLGQNRPIEPSGVGETSQSPKYFHLENKISVPPKDVQSTVPPPPPVKVSQPIKIGMPVRATAAITQGPISDEKLLEDHEEPHIDLKTNLPKEATKDAVKIPMPPTPPTPPTPPNLPGSMPAQTIPPGARFSPRPVETASVREPVIPKTEVPVAPKPAVPPVPPVAAVTPMQEKPVVPAIPSDTAKPYSADPYREPIDEK